MVVSDSEPEFVAETQPTRAATKRKEKAEAKCWEPLEVLVLAQSWIDISEDATVGKDQKHDRFWIHVLHRFHKGMNHGEHRSKHQVYLKWGKMNKEVMLFNDLYNNMKRQWKSGENDDVILRKALEVYQKENPKAFKFLEFHHLPDQWEETKQKSKGKGKGKASDSDELKEMGADMKGIKDRMNKILQIASERELRKQRDSDMRILSLETSHMTGDELQIISTMKEEVNKRYANRG
ncbi:glutathione S-transferase T3-like [Lactuca sativa]|uniref:glutathione S-transferase T3-like n=1 Tax=Lactuca sativa TaxID=4236 RepID=UPI001C68AD25|nr:glutathione S-transferase T3-like [Lactuca sativa]